MQNISSHLSDTALAVCALSSGCPLLCEFVSAWLIRSVIVALLSRSVSPKQKSTQLLLVVPEFHRPLSQERSDGRLASTVVCASASTAGVLEPFPATFGLLTMRCLPVSPTRELCTLECDEFQDEPLRRQACHPGENHLCIGLCAFESQQRYRLRSHIDTRRLRQEEWQ